MAEHDAYLPFSPAESTELRKMLGASNATVVCPRCRGALKFTAGPGDDPKTAVWELECNACQRRLVVGEHAE